MKKLLLFTGFICFYFNANTQIVTNNTPTATQLAQILAGPNITVSNATLTGSNLASGSFNGTSNIGIGSGVILSTGNVNEAVGPNNAGGVGANLGQPGTAQMDTLAGNGGSPVNTFDAVILEFDFDVQSDLIQFNYVFASEEYPEYAPPNNSGFNDVFAFYISGPGITGEENIAIVPNTTSVVSINNINAITNNQYYVDNTGGTTIQYDAFTTVLQAKRENLIPCNTYHLKLVIADAGDGVWSSGVFLEENSLIQGTVDVTSNTVNSDDIALEGCIEASFTFSLDNPAAQNTDISFQIAGDATNGIDYNYVDSILTIPAGQTSATVFIQALADGVPEGQETVMIIYQSQPCSPPDTVTLYIDDAQPIEYTLSGVNLDCNNDNSGEIHVNATGGFQPYTYHVTDENGNVTDYSTDPITGLAAGEYTVQVYDIYGCKADALVIGGLYDADTTFLPDGSGVTYTTTIDIQGFDPGATLDSLSQLNQICATMEHSYLGDLILELISPSGQQVTLKGTGGGSCDLGEPIATAPVDGAASSTLTDPGTGYEYCWIATPTYGTMVAESNNYSRNYTDAQGHNYTDNYLPQGSYQSTDPLAQLLGSSLNGTWTLEITDQFGLDNGYIFEWNVSLMSGLPDSTVNLYEPAGVDIQGFVTQANCGGADGAINISVTGDHSPFSYLWSNGATTEDISNLTAGTYTVYVTDTTLCTDSATFILNNISSINTTANITPASCISNSDGSIDLLVSGGTPPYNISWSNGATTEDISALSVGTYTVTILDANGCQYSNDYTVTSLPPIQINLDNLSNEQCGNFNGSISVGVSGGTGSYAYNWSNGASTEDISGLNAGTYTLSVSDANGCSATQTYSIINNVSSCSNFCYLAVDNILVTDDNCGGGQGAIDVNITGATLPYIVSWSNGASTDDISNLTPGIYTIMVEDADNCTETVDITVGNNTGNLVISNSSISSENCGNGMGLINLTVSGGVLPYTFSWSDGQSTEDASNLSAGTYMVDITDANGCMLSQSFTVGNNTGNLNYTATVVHDTCSAGVGSIDISVNGANGTPTFSWDNGATTEDLSNLSTGSYTLTITDGSGCSLTTSAIDVLNESGSLSLDNIDMTQETCSDAAGAIDLTLSGGSSPYIFNWSNGAATEDLNGLSAGAYSATITDQNGCSVSTGNLNIFNTPSNLAVNTNYIQNEICGNMQGAVNVDVTGGDGNYSYTWSSGSTSQDLSGLSAGSYNLTVTDGSGCTTTYSANIINTQGNLSVDQTIVNNETCGDGSGAIDLIISGASNPVSYNWSNGATSQDISGLNSGSYSYIITDNNGCTVNGAVNVGNNAANINYVESITAEICGNGQGAIDITVSGGQTPYTYLWSNGATTEDLTGLSAGVYTVTITDNNGCSLTSADFNLPNNSSGMSLTGVGTDENCGQANGAIDLTVNGGNSPFTFNWSNGATTEDLSALSAGNYSVTVNDQNGCSATSSFTINNAAANLNLDNITINNELCGNGNGNIDISVSGGTTPLSFGWSNGASTEDISGLSSGNFNVTITDANGCAINSGNIVLSNDPGTLSVDNVNVVNEQCGNGLGAIQITISGGVSPYIFNWSNGAITQNLTGLSSGTYACTITDQNGCTTSLTSNVGNTAGSLNVNSSIVTDETCSASNGAIDISVQGGTIPYTYAWSNGATTQDLNGLSAGNYSVLITDNNGCDYTYNETVSNNGAGLNISSSNVSDEVCGNSAGSIDISVSGGNSPYTFSWSNGAITEDLSGLSMGSYTVNITDANGCTNGASYTVNNFSGTLSLDNVSVSDENCGQADGAIDVTVSGGSAPISFSWSNGATTEDLSGLSAGSYSLTVSDQFGCSIQSSQNIANITGGFAATIASTNDENCGDGTGSIDINVTGGSSPYSFIWDNGATTEDLSSLSAGTYNLTVTDANGCSATLSATINNQTTGLTLNNAVIQDEQCGDGSGFIDLQISGGSLPYSFNWSNGVTTEDLSGLSAGTYTCVITDASGCNLNFTGTVGGGTGSLAISNLNVTDETCADATGEVIVTASGIAPISFQWNGVPPSSCCNFTLNMFDAGNSWNGASIDVLVNGINVGNFTVPGGGQNVGTFNACDGDNVQLIWNSGAFDNEVFFNLEDPNGVILYNHPQGAGPTPGVIYTYNAACSGSSSNTLVQSDLNAGQYLVTITDGVGCSIDTLVDINNTQTLFLNSIYVEDDTCGQGDGDIQVVYTGNAPFNHVWSGGTPIGCCDYTLQMQDAGNSWNGASIDVLVNGINVGNFTVPGGGFNVETFPTCSGDQIELQWNSGAFDNEVSFQLVNGLGVIEYQHFQGSGPNIGSIYTGSATCGASTSDTTAVTDLTAGIYNLITTDANGCMIDTNITVNDISNPQVSITAININDESCNLGNATVDVVVAGTASMYQLGAIQQSSSNFSGFAQGTYVLTITDINGCSIDSSITISNSDPFNITVNTITDEACNESNGGIDISVSPTGTYTYSWSNGASTEDISLVPAGNYTVIVSDGTCSISLDTLVDVAAPFSVSNIISDESCGDGAGAIDISISNGSGTYNFNWSNGATTEDISGLSAGNYSVEIEDLSTGCTDTLNYTVNNITNGMNATTSVADDNCSAGNGAIDLSMTGGSGNFSFVWSNGANTEDLSNISGGTYTVNITDNADGCEMTMSFTVGSTASFSLSGVVNNASCSNCPDGSVDLTLGGSPTLPVSFSWSNGATTEDISNLTPGQYIVTATDANGCVVVDTFNVNGPDALFETELNWLVDIYPNPTHGEFTLTFELATTENVQISLYNSIGQLLQLTDINSNKGTQLFNLSTYDWGVYFVVLQSNGQQMTKRVVLMK